MLSGLIYSIRLVRVGFVLAREGALALIDPAVLPPAARGLLRAARLVERQAPGGGASRLAAALTRLGPSWVKFGQFLATRPDVVGVRVARDLEALQDRMPPFPRADAVKSVETAFGKPLASLFKEFGEPVAAASIAQVHKARLVEGPEGYVAVKVLRPGIHGRFQRDLGAMQFAAQAIERLVPATQRLKPREVVETLARSVTIEMDLRLEAAGLSELAENTRDDPDFRTPQVHWNLTEREVMTSEWVDAVALSDLAALEAAGHDRVALGRTLIQSFLRHSLRDGFFHADMHPGNLFVDAQGRIVAVDFGIMGRLGPKERRFLAEILYGFITRDYHRVAEVHFEAGYVPRRHSVADFAQAIRAIGEPIHNRRADEISMARLLTLLFEVTGLFDMATRPELVMLQKTMVVVEGVARTLDPKLDMWSTSDPVVREWIARHLGPVGRLEDAGRGALSLISILGQLPEALNQAARIAKQMERASEAGFSLAEETVEAVGKAEARGSRWGHAALWLIAIVFFILLWRNVF